MSTLLKQYLDVTQMEEAKPLSNANDDLDKQISSTEEMLYSEHVADQNLPLPNTRVEELQDNEQKDSSSLEPEKSTKPQFKNVVAIVDPPRSGLHPAVIKALRTHPRLKRLVLVLSLNNHYHKLGYFDSVSSLCLITELPIFALMQVHFVQP